MAEPGRQRYRKWQHPFRDHPQLAFRFDVVAGALAEQIEQGRTAAGLTVEQLADRAGLSTQGTINLRKVQSDPKVSTLVRLAAALGRPLRLVIHPAPSTPL